MEMRRLGGTGLVTSAIGLNGLAFVRGCGPVDRPHDLAVLAHALDSGITLIDAADGVRGGVEALVGRAVRRRRDEVVLATRGGARFTPKGQLIDIDGRPDRLARDCDASLRRLGVDHVDLYYLARVDPLVPIEDSVAALAGLVEVGKIRQLGLSEVDAGQLRRAHAVYPIAALANRYSLLDRQVEKETLATARTLGVGVVAASPLAHGLLTGRIASIDQLSADDYRRGHPAFQPDPLAHSRALVRAAQQLAAQKDVSLGRLALAWLLAQGLDIVPLPGTRSRTHLETDIAAIEVELSAEECAQLSALAAPDPAT
jgi:aryl-alcohol dehydrogenase-like predicted oxidoreductase